MWLRLVKLYDLVFKPGWQPTNFGTGGMGDQGGYVEKRTLGDEMAVSEAVYVKDLYRLDTMWRRIRTR